MKLFQSLWAGIALISLANPALAAGCATPSEASALKTSVMLQQMMVAAFQCREKAAYNGFINTYRGELQSSDAALKAFFVRRSGEAGYDTFKTKAANLSGLEQARDSRGFCADTRALFAAAAQHRGTLASFVESRSAGMDAGLLCRDARPVLAKADKPVVRLAEAEAVSKSDIAIGGVPDHAIPASPYRRENIAPPPRAAAPEPEEDEYFDDEEYPGPVIVRDQIENLPAAPAPIRPASALMAMIARMATGAMVRRQTGNGAIIPRRAPVIAPIRATIITTTDQPSTRSTLPIIRI